MSYLIIHDYGSNEPISIIQCETIEEIKKAIEHDRYNPQIFQCKDITDLILRSCGRIK